MIETRVRPYYRFVLTRWSRPDGSVLAAAPVTATPMPDLRRVFREHYDRIWRLLRSLGVPSDRVDDAAQQVFLVYAQRQRDVVPGSEGSFLYGTALRVARNLRLARIREVPADVEETPPVEPVGADELSDQKRARELLDRILGDMEADLRAVFVLYEVEELTVPQIAGLLDVPLGTAASRLRRAREQFASMVKRYAAAQSRRDSVKPDADRATQAVRDAERDE